MTWCNRRNRRMRRKRHLLLLAIQQKVKKRLPFRRRKCGARPSYLASNWAQMLLQRQCEDPSSKAGKLFRRRFRVPYPIFANIVTITREKAWFREHDGIGRPSCPLELKILGVLRILGRGMCFDGISELTNIGEEAIRVFFHSFCAKFSLQKEDPKNNKMEARKNYVKVVR